jgi:hypothetical protein
MDVHLCELTTYLNSLDTLRANVEPTTLLLSESSVRPTTLDETRIIAPAAITASDVVLERLSSSMPHGQDVLSKYSARFLLRISDSYDADSIDALASALSILETRARIHATYNDATTESAAIGTVSLPVVFCITGAQVSSRRKRSLIIDIAPPDCTSAAPADAASITVSALIDGKHVCGSPQRFPRGECTTA